MHVGEPHVPAAVAVGEPLVVQPEQVQHRRVQVVRGDRLLFGLVAEVVGGPDRLAALDPGPRHPGRLRPRVVIASHAPLRDRHPTELSMPHHQCGVQEPAGLQVRQEPRDRLVRLGGVQRVILHEVAVGVPGVGVLVAHPAHEELDEPDPALDEPARHEALPAERLGELFVEAVELPGRFRFRGDVDGFRRAPLHPVGELVGGDPRRELRVARIPLHVDLVQPRQGIEPRPLLFPAHSLGWLEVHDRVAR